MSAQRLVHHELCFGCGRTNLFGLLMEIEPTGERRVRGRGFIKQDHQGSIRGVAHDAIVLAALSEAMSFACGPAARATSLELQIDAAAPVGVFLDVEAEVVEVTDDVWHAAATATVEDRRVANGRGSYRLR